MITRGGVIADLDAAQRLAVGRPLEPPGLPALLLQRRIDAVRELPLARRLLLVEVVLVLALSLGRSGVYALVNLLASATAPGRARPARRPSSTAASPRAGRGST